MAAGAGQQRIYRAACRWHRSASCKISCSPRRRPLRSSRGCFTKASQRHPLRAGREGDGGRRALEGCVLRRPFRSCRATHHARQQWLLVSQSADRLDLHLTDGSTHESDPKNPDQYQISTFQVDRYSDPSAGGAEPPAKRVGFPERNDARATASDRAYRRCQLTTLGADRISSATGAAYGVSGAGHGRRAFGLSSKKGGKSSGFVLTILLVFLYYSISLIGVSLARQSRLSPAAGVWMADSFFLLGGAFLLWQSERRPISFWFRGSKEPLAGRSQSPSRTPAHGFTLPGISIARELYTQRPRPADFPSLGVSCTSASPPFSTTMCSAIFCSIWS